MFSLYLIVTCLIALPVVIIGLALVYGGGRVDGRDA